MARRPELIGCWPPLPRPAGTPEQLAQRNKAETLKWEKAIREAKIEAQ